MAEKAAAAAAILREKNISVSVINMEFAKPLDRDRLMKSAGRYPLIVTLEDNVVTGGAGEKIRSLLADEDVRVVNIGWPDKFIEHGTCEELYRKYGMDARSIAERIEKELERKA